MLHVILLFINRPSETETVMFVYLICFLLPKESHFFLNCFSNLMGMDSLGSFTCILPFFTKEATCVTSCLLSCTSSPF